MATFFEPPIQKLRVEAFRGFRDQREFDLAASAVIVTGPNGTGKTSFFDALQWGLLGSIDRLEARRGKKSVEHLVNQYRLGEPAVVEIDLLVRGNHLTIRRTGDHSGSSLELRVDGSEPRFGQEAETALRDALITQGEMTLEMALMTSGLMQQDVMRSVLEANAADRYQQLGTVLGLGRLEDFEQSANEAASDAKKRADGVRSERDIALASVQDARRRLADATERLNSLPQLESLRKEILAGAESSAVRLDISQQDLATAERVEGFASILGSAIDEVESFLHTREKRALAAKPLRPQVSAAEIEQAQANADSAGASVIVLEQSLALADAKYVAATSATEELASLAAVAIPLLSASCPVCGQAIDPDHVASELRSRAENTDVMLSLRAEVHGARAELDLTRKSANDLRQRLSELSLINESWSAFRAAEESVSDAYVALSDSIDQRVLFAARNLDAFVDQSEASLDYLRSMRRKLLELLNSLNGSADQGALERAASEASNLEDSLQLREEKLRQEALRSQQLKSLADQTVKARVAITQGRFAAVQPLVADIFSRLDPHPAFKSIEFELDTYYRKGRTSPMVRDLVADIAADPLLIFSTSQANIAALSYFLAMGISVGGKGLPFILLDDPVQSMDDVNVLGFADLCRHLRRSRQLIISTHDRRFSGLLDRKLAPRHESESTGVIEFMGWDRSGPAVMQRTIDPQVVDDPIRIVKPNKS